MSTDLSYSDRLYLCVTDACITLECHLTDGHETASTQMLVDIAKRWSLSDQEVLYMSSQLRAIVGLPFDHQP